MDSRFGKPFTRVRIRSTWTSSTAKRRGRIGSVATVIPVNRTRGESPTSRASSPSKVTGWPRNPERKSLAGARQRSTWVSASRTPVRASAASTSATAATSQRRRIPRPMSRII